MIEINLVPTHLRKTKKTSSSLTVTNVPKEAIIGLVGGLFTLLFLTHLVLFVVMVIKFTQYSHLEKEIEKIDSVWQEAKTVLLEMRSLQNKIEAVRKVTTAEQVSWSGKLNDVSDSIPKGVWLNKLSLDENVLLIDGSSVSKEHNEMISVGTFTANLKDLKSFMSGLNDIEVGSIQRRQIRSVEVADFLITVRLK